MTNRIVLCLILFAAAAFAQEQNTAPPAPSPTKTATAPAAPAPAYTLTELQRAHLHEYQLVFFIAARDEQKALDDFYSGCNQIAAENHWPPGTKCNVQDLSVIPASPQPPAAEKKK